MLSCTDPKLAPVPPLSIFISEAAPSLPLTSTDVQLIRATVLLSAESIVIISHQVDFPLFACRQIRVESKQFCMREKERKKKGSNGFINCSQDTRGGSNQQNAARVVVVGFYWFSMQADNNDCCMHRPIKCFSVYFIKKMILQFQCLSLNGS